MSRRCVRSSTRATRARKKQLPSARRRRPSTAPRRPSSPPSMPSSPCPSTLPSGRCRRRTVQGTRRFVAPRRRCSRTPSPTPRRRVACSPQRRPRSRSFRPRSTGSSPWIRHSAKEPCARAPKSSLEAASPATPPPTPVSGSGVSSPRSRPRSRPSSRPASPTRSRPPHSSRTRAAIAKDVQNVPSAHRPRVRIWFTGLFDAQCYLL